MVSGARGKNGESERRKSVIAAGRDDTERWHDLTNFEDSWNARAMRAADYIPAGARVLDLGCGTMSLEQFLPDGCVYLPCDLTQRDSRTQVCNFNAGEMPDLSDADIVTVLGVLEYLYDAPGFIRRLAEAGKPIILSYCPTDTTANLDRRGLGWINDYSLSDIRSMVETDRFSIRRHDQIDQIQSIFLLCSPSPALSPPKSVLVLSYNNVGNFGDRLGYHLVNAALPSNTEVTFANFKPWNVPSDDFDLLVLGIGNSLFTPLLTDDLVHLLDRIPASVGIFGTQYRQQIPRHRLEAVLDRLTVWYARYQEDIQYFGRGRSNVQHLGDWLISAFPMTTGRNTQPLTIGDEIWDDLPLDRTIQHIQSYAKVLSTRVHPLLCAVTSAEEVAYREQWESGDENPSGKFRSMLIDVFGRTFPEERYWPVDRHAVRSYKRLVDTSVATLRADLARLLT